MPSGEPAGKLRIQRRVGPSPGCCLATGTEGARGLQGCGIRLTHSSACHLGCARAFCFLRPPRRPRHHQQTPNVFWRGRTSRGPSSPADVPMNALGQHSSSRMGTESCCLPRPEPASGGRKTAQATAESSYLLPGMTASGPRARPHRQHGWRHSNLAHSRQGGGGAQG